MNPQPNQEYQLTKAILLWLVAIKLITPGEAKVADELNKKSFGVFENKS